MNIKSNDKQDRTICLFWIMRGFSRNCSSHYDGNSTRMQSPTPVVCKHPRLQDYTSPLQVLQVASGDFLKQGALPLPPLLLTAHMKAGAASRGPRQVNSSRNHCRPQTSARTHTHLLFVQEKLNLHCKPRPGSSLLYGFCSGDVWTQKRTD